MQFRKCVSRLTQDYYYYYCYNHTVKVVDVGDTQATLINVAFGRKQDIKIDINQTPYIITVL